MNEKTKQLIVDWYKYVEGTYFCYVVHFLAGFAVATIVGHFVGSLLAMMFTCIVGIGKECVDEYSGLGEVNFRSAIMTAVGGFVAALFL